MSPHVLIVEDDDILRDIYSVKFELEGFAVTAAEDGIAGLEQAALQQPDLIILDMLMPRLGGMEFLRRIRAKHGHLHAKILVASNKSNAESIAEAKSLGAADYLIKSQLTPEDIVNRARRHLDGSPA